MRKREQKQVFAGFGAHNLDLAGARERLQKARSYQDLSTVWFTPTRGMIPAKVVFESWLNFMAPMNQKFFRMNLPQREVGDAYNWAVETILAHPELSKWKYLLTVEEDNAPPPDGVLKLYESMDKYDAVGGLYFTKGIAGQPMIYGDPSVMPKTFIPQIPVPDVIQPCNGLGMGFTLFKIAMFKKLPSPWFRTVQEYNPGVGGATFTQDLWFFNNAGREGFKFASDNRVKVGHWDEVNQTMW
jgi:hypothetical protein